MLPCDNAQQHVQLMELASAITASLVVDEDGALLHRAARYRRGVARLLAGRADRAERLGHQVLAMRPPRSDTRDAASAPALAAAAGRSEKPYGWGSEVSRAES